MKPFKYDIDWLESTTFQTFKRDVRRLRPGSKATAAVNALLNSPRGRAIAKQMLNDPDYRPVIERRRELLRGIVRMSLGEYHRRLHTPEYRQRLRAAGLRVRGIRKFLKKASEEV